jgi:hypothetical protein
LSGSVGRRVLAVAGGFTLLGTVLVGLGLSPALAATTWTPSEAPLPANAATTTTPTSFELNALTCPTADWCVAVGTYLDTEGNQESFIDTLAGGVWTPSEAPLPTASVSSGLEAVTCFAAGSCLAVGGYSGAVADDSEPLVETLSNEVWMASEAPVPSYPPVQGQFGAGGYFTSMSCPNLGSCVALGQYDVENDELDPTQLFIDTLAAGTWTTTQAPLPPGAATYPYDEWDGLSCPAVGSCVAVATLIDTDSIADGLIETLSEGSWTATQAPLPAGAGVTTPYARLGAIACPAVGSCVAVGGYTDTDGNYQGLVEALSGGAWAATEAAAPANAATGYQNAGLEAVACPAAGSCMAVGRYIDTKGTYEGVMDSLSGGAWKATEAPAPTNTAGQGDFVDAVSCPGTGSCVAVGNYFDMNDDVEGLIDTWAQGVWTPTEAPLPADASSETSPPSVGLSAVTCPAVGSCAAVGTYGVGSGAPGEAEPQAGLIETLSGGPNPTNPSATLIAPTHSSIALGQAVTEMATVTGNATGGNPTGAVSFYECGPNPAPTPCTFLSNLVGGPVSVTPGSDDTSSATSVSMTPDAPGYWCFAAYYSGDSNYDASSDATTGGCIGVDAATTVIAPTNAFITVGQSNTEVATVTGNATEGNPTGTVAFYECDGPLAMPCTSLSTPIGAPVILVAGSDDTAFATSPSFTPDRGGNWCVAAVYSGDSNYISTSDVTADGCFGINEATPSIVDSTTTSGPSTVDVATVTGIAAAGPPSGWVTFYECGPTVEPTPCTSTANPVGDAISLTAGNDDTATATSASIQPETGGYWCFAAYFSGDGTYSSSIDTTTDGCFDIPPTIVGPDTATFTEGTAATPVQVTSVGGYRPITYSETGELPSGVTLSSSGVLSGTPGWVAGQFPFTITATDASGNVGSEDFVLTVAPSPVPHITTTSPLPAAKLGVAYSVTLTATGGTTPYRWDIISSGLPQGLRLDHKTGTISGTPRGRPRVHHFEVQVSHRGKTATADFSMTIR